MGRVTPRSLLRPATMLAGAAAFTVVSTALLILASGLLAFDAARSPTVPAVHLAAGGGQGPTPASSFPTPIRHVVVVMMENYGLSQVLGGAPFETYLWKTYAHASNYYGLCHPSLGNYLAATSGTAIGCGTDNFYTYPIENVADLASAHGLSWMSFAESMSAPCSASNSSVFSNVFTPLLHYADIADNATYCDAHIQPVTPNGTWYQDINGTVPNFVWYAPNKIDNGHSSSLATGDSWLKGWLSPLLNRSWAASTAFLLAFDEGSNNSGFSVSGTSTPTCTSSAATSACGGQVWMVAVSPFSKAGVAADYTARATHYNLLATAEWLLGVGTTGHNDSSTSFAPMTSLFSVPSPAGNFSLRGEVTTGTSGAGLPNASVSVAGGPTTTTNATGGFVLGLSDGNYTVTAAAPGYVPSSTAVRIDGANVSVDLSLAAVTSTLYPVSGVVDLRANGTPAPDATVRLAGIGSAVTGTNGSFLFLAPNGTYVLSAQRSGDLPQQVTVTVSGAPVVRDFSLVLVPEFAYRLDGSVHASATGAALVGVNVSVSTSQWSSTNSSGGYAFELPNGTYSLRFVDAGFVTALVDVTVSGAPIVRNLALVEATGPGSPGNTSGPSPGPSTATRSHAAFDPLPLVAVAVVSACALGLFALYLRRRHP